MRIKFYLERPESKNETVIFGWVAYNGNRLRIYTGQSIKPKFWNAKLHSAKNTPAFREGSSLNVRLDSIKSTITKCYLDYQNEHEAIPSPPTFKHLIETALGRTKETKLNFFEYYQNFIDRTDTGQRRNAKGRIIKPAKAYKVTLTNLKDFNAKWNKKLDFDTIDLDFYGDYLKFLQKKKLAENTIGRDIKNIKAVLNDATENGVNKNLAFKSKRFSKPTEDVDNIALSESELKEIQDIDLLNTPHLDNVRDLFLIGCYTGLRYSDFSRLTSNNIKDGFIDIKKQVKTGEPVVIPVHPVVKSIIAKYKGNLPESTSNQKTNQYLKDICKQAPTLCTPVSKTTTKGGVKVTVNYKRWEIVTTHTGRRTFATNAYLQGISTITIMAITGHKTEKAFLKYIKVTPKEHAEIMARIWARKGKLKVAN